MISAFMIADTTVAANNNPPPPGFFAFMVVWLALGISSFVFFRFNRNAALKRKVWPILVIGAGFVFAVFSYFFVGRQQIASFLPIFIPAIILITWLNLRTTRFCDGCGRTLYRQSFLKRTRYCPYCGVELK